jgi:putative sterol carrier protein
MDLETVFEKLNSKLASEPSLLADVNAVYQIQVGENFWHVDFSQERKVKRGAHSKPELQIEFTPESFEKLIAGTLNITLALALRKIKVSGSLSHLAKLKELFA